MQITLSGGNFGGEPVEIAKGKEFIIKEDASGFWVYSTTASKAADEAVFCFFTEDADELTPFE